MRIIRIRLKSGEELQYELRPEEDDRDEVDPKGSVLLVTGWACEYSEVETDAGVIRTRTKERHVEVKIDIKDLSYYELEI